MDASINQQSSLAQQPGSVLARLRILGSILNWLAGFIQLTEEELENAGVYLGE